MLREGVISGEIVPVLCGSSLKLIGVSFLLDAVGRYLPSPLDRPIVRGRGLKEEEGEEVKGVPRTDAPFSALVFKTIVDPYAGKISIIRVFSGSLQSDSTIYNSTKGSREKIGQVYRMMGKKQTPISPALFGDIVALAKLKEVGTGDTLCIESDPVLIPAVQLPQATISYAIQPRTRADEDKLMTSLNRIREEDPTVQFKREEETREFLLSGTGQTHVEITVEKLKNKYGVNVEMRTPKVPYKETIRTSAKAEGKYIKQTGGRGQYGDAWIEIEPLPRGEGYEFMDKIVGGVIPRNFIPSVEKGVKEAMQHGVLTGYPVVDIRVSLFDGKYHSVDSSDIAFKIAGSLAFKKAMEGAKPVLLEPIMSVETFTPDDCLGDVIGDINSKRGRVVAVETQSGSHVVKSFIPMAEILSYSPELRSITSGRGTFTMEFSHYEEVPDHVAAKIVEAAQKEKKAEEEK